MPIEFLFSNEVWFALATGGIGVAIITVFFGPPVKAFFENRSAHHYKQKEKKEDRVSDAYVDTINKVTEARRILYSHRKFEKQFLIKMEFFEEIRETIREALSNNSSLLHPDVCTCLQAVVDVTPKRLALGGNRFVILPENFADMLGADIDTAIKKHRPA